MWISVLGPPWQALVTSSLPLYLNNQEELYHDVSVTYPFIGAAFLIACIAFPLYYVALRNRALSHALWFYYFSGFAFLGVVAIRHSQTGLVFKVGALIAIVVGFTLVQLAAHRWWDLRRASGYFALFAIGFVAVDALEFQRRHVALPEELESIESGIASGVSDRPNFYHIILDEYQTDLFELTLNDEVKRELGGFDFFDDAVTVFGRTQMSLGTVFSGRNYDFSSPQGDYQWEAFAGEQSMLTRVKDAGYLTEGYLHDRLFSFIPPFHLVRFHQEPTGYDRIATSGLFAELWSFANLPSFISARLLEEERFANFESQNILNPAAPIKSLHTFDYLIRREASQSGRGRYVFAHLILPHFPNVLDSDCSYTVEGAKTDPVRQSKCATALVIKLVNTLKRLGRFRDSLIIVQSDHGARFAIVDGSPRPVAGMRDFGNEWNSARARSLLLIKRPGRDSKGTVQRSSAPASLLDVFPTVSTALGLDAGETDGIDLFDAQDLVAASARKRWYYFFMKKGQFGWTDEMVRFRVEDGRAIRDGVQVLTGNPPP